MSHVRPDTCAFEYTDAYRHAASVGTEEAARKRDRLAERIRTVEARGEQVPFLRAALRGYEDYLAFMAGTIPAGQRMSP